MTRTVHCRDSRFCSWRCQQWQACLTEMCREHDLAASVYSCFEIAQATQVDLIVNQEDDLIGARLSVI